MGCTNTSLAALALTVIRSIIDRWRRGADSRSTILVADFGGSPQTLTDAPEADSGTWSREGVILFTTDGPLHRVSDSGGASSPVTRVEEEQGELGNSWPIFLPDGRHFLYLRYLGRQVEPNMALACPNDRKDHAIGR